MRCLTILHSFVVAMLLFTASSARADKPDAEDGPNHILKWITVDSTARSTVIEKMESTQDQRTLDIPLLPYEQPTWSSLCVTPCRARVDLNGIYRVGPINDVTPSHAFTLSPDIAAVHVNAGPYHLDRLGRILVAVGAIAFLSGATTALATDDSGTRRVGLGLGGAGLIGLAVGIPLWLISGTNVRFN